MPFTRLRRNLFAAAVAFSAVGTFACSDRSEVTAPDQPAAARGGAQGPDLRAALAAKDKYTGQLLAKEGVVGTAVGLDVMETPS